MHRENYKVFDEETGEFLFAARIACPDDVNEAYKKCLAIKWAEKNGVPFTYSNPGKGFSVPEKLKESHAGRMSLIRKRLWGER